MKSQRPCRLPRRPRKFRKGLKRGFRPAKNVAEWASCSVTQWIGQVTTANVMYNLRNISLSQFQRAVQVAQAYQHYRIKKVMLEFKPAFDTFAPQSTGGVNLQVPYLIYMIDKSGSVPVNVDSTALGQMGAKPIRFDDKTIKVAYRPSVLDRTLVKLTHNLHTRYHLGCLQMLML